MKRKLSLYEQADNLARAYFGLDAAKEIAKFIQTHLRKPVEELTKDELVSLTDWIKSTAIFLAEDEALAERYIKDLLNLVDQAED